MNADEWIEQFAKALYQGDKEQVKVLLITAVDLGYLTNQDLEEMIEDFKETIH